MGWNSTQLRDKTRKRLDDLRHKLNKKDDEAINSYDDAINYALDAMEAK